MPGAVFTEGGIGMKQPEQDLNMLKIILKNEWPFRDLEQSMRFRMRSPFYVQICPRFVLVQICW